jgi:MYXO-CTERM domain-containing protein
MSQRSFFLGFLIAAGLLPLTGCSAGPEGFAPEVLGVVGEEIKGGYDDTKDTNVVLIINPTAGYLCSGSLIAPNVILTAQHCVAPVLGDSENVSCTTTKFDKSYSPADLFVTTKPVLTIPPAREDYHAARQVLTAEGSSVCGSDQAIIILEDLIGPAEAVPLVPRVDTSLAENEEYYAVGYGAAQDPEDMENPTSGTRRRRDDLFVNCVGTACLMRAANGPEVAGTEWEGQEGICGGDSGGPALDLSNRVVGVTSRGGADCTSPVYGHVFGLGQWIMDTTVFAAGLAGYPAPVWATGGPTDPAFSFPVGGSCTKAEDCASGRCMNDGVAQYCTRLCSVQAPCEAGFTCEDTVNNVCVQSGEVTKDGTPTTISSGCSVSRSGEADPRRPVPWFTGAALFALAMIRRRSRTRSALKLG